jgi:hypothetical protein
VSVSITCTKLSGTTVSAQAKASETATVTWMLVVSREGQPQTTLPPSSSSHNGELFSATWSNVPSPATYDVSAAVGADRSEAVPVPFGTCT